MERENAKVRPLVTPVSDLTLAALLLAMGFEAYTMRRVEDHDLTSTGRSAAGRVCWEFSPVGDAGMRFDEVARAWKGALRDEPGVPPAVRAARLAVHNCHCLTAAAKDGAPLYAYDGVDGTRLSNDALSGARLVPRRMAPEAPAVTLRTTGAAACALAVGCRLQGVIYSGDGCLWCVSPGVCGGPQPLEVEMRWRDLNWVTSPGNVSPLAVAIATLLNRRELLGSVHQGSVVHLVRSGGSALYLPADAPKDMVERGSRLLNM